MSRVSRLPIDELRRRTSNCLVLHGKSPSLGYAVETQSEAIAILALAGIKNREIAKALGRSPAHVASLKRSTLRQLRQPLARRQQLAPQVALAATPTLDDTWFPALDLSIDELADLIVELGNQQELFLLEQDQVK